jgi:hypothetical protein
VVFAICGFGRVMVCSAVLAPTRRRYGWRRRYAAGGRVCHAYITQETSGAWLLGKERYGWLAGGNTAAVYTVPSCGAALYLHSTQYASVGRLHPLALAVPTWAARGPRLSSLLPPHRGACPASRGAASVRARKAQFPTVMRGREKRSGTFAER